MLGWVLVRWFGRLATARASFRLVVVGVAFDVAVRLAGFVAGGFGRLDPYDVAGEEPLQGRDRATREAGAVPDVRRRFRVGRRRSGVRPCSRRLIGVPRSCGGCRGLVPEPLG